jgi:signal peptidase II
VRFTRCSCRLPAWHGGSFRSCSCIGCDQWTKSLATEHLKQAPALSFLGDTLRIQYAENPGAFLGAGSRLPASTRFAILVVVNALFLALIAGLMLMRRPAGRAQHLAIVLLLAGGIGNLIDRMFHDGLVIDFLNVGIGPVRTGIFNVADMAIMAGFGLLLLYRGPASAPPNSATGTPASGLLSEQSSASGSQTPQAR